MSGAHTENNIKTKKCKDCCQTEHDDAYVVVSTV